MKRAKLFIACTVLVLLASCATTTSWTPIQWATFFMATYNSEAENYRRWAALPDLTETEREILRKRKAAMTEIYSLIEIYNRGVVEGKPDEAARMLIEAKIIDLQRYLIRRADR